MQSLWISLSLLARLSTSSCMAALSPDAAISLARSWFGTSSERSSAVASLFRTGIIRAHFRLIILTLAFPFRAPDLTEFAPFAGNRNAAEFPLDFASSEADNAREGRVGEVNICHLINS